MMHAEAVAETSNGTIDIVVSKGKSQLKTMTRGARQDNSYIQNVAWMVFMRYWQVEMQGSLVEMQLGV
jgi:hypothetical protein